MAVRGDYTGRNGRTYRETVPQGDYFTSREAAEEWLEEHLVDGTLATSQGRVYRNIRVEYI